MALNKCRDLKGCAQSALEGQIRLPHKNSWKRLEGGSPQLFYSWRDFGGTFSVIILLFSRVLPYSWRLLLSPAIPRVPRLSSYLILKPVPRDTKP